MVAGIPKQMENDPSCDHQFGRNRNVTDDYFQFMATSSLTTCAESVEFSHARRAKAALCGSLRELTALCNCVP